MPATCVQTADALAPSTEKSDFTRPSYRYISPMPPDRVCPRQGVDACAPGYVLDSRYTGGTCHRTEGNAIHGYELPPCALHVSSC